MYGFQVCSQRDVSYYRLPSRQDNSPLGALDALGSLPCHDPRGKVVVVALTVRDCYEAFVVYSFLTLILEHAGGDYNCIEQIKHLPPVREWGCVSLFVRVTPHLSSGTRYSMLKTWQIDSFDFNLSWFGLLETYRFGLFSRTPRPPPCVVANLRVLNYGSGIFVR